MQDLTPFRCLIEPSSASHSAHALGTNCNRYLCFGGFSDVIDVNFNGMCSLAHT